MKISFRAFSQRGTGKFNNEDADLLNGQVFQGRVREQGEVDSSQPLYFAEADGVAIGTCPRTASRRLLELPQTRLHAADANAPLIHRMQKNYVATGVSSRNCTAWHGIRAGEAAPLTMHESSHRLFAVPRASVLKGA